MANISDDNRSSKAVFEILKSNSKLDLYGVQVCIYGLAAFLGWCLYFWKSSGNSSTFCTFNTNSALTPPDEAEWCTRLKNDIKYDDTAFSTFSYFTAGTFASSFLMQILQLADSEIKDSIKRAPIFCTAVVNLVSFMTHLSFGLRTFPIIVSPFGRVTHLARWGEWVSLVPILMVMMHALDIRDKNDERYMWISTAIIQTSVITGGIASYTRNFNLAVFMMVLSFLTYFHIFYTCWRSLRRYKVILDVLKAKRSVEDSLIKDLLVKPEIPIELSTEPTGVAATKYSQAAKLANSVIHASAERSKGNKSYDAFDATSSSDLVTHASSIAIVLSAKLTVYCVVSWTFITLVYTLGMFNVIDSTTECIWQSVADVFAKMVYVQVICNSHGSSLSPEGLLSRMLLYEEKAHSSIRQFLRFICHEIVSPLDCIKMGLDALKEQTLDTEGVEVLGITEESTDDIFSIVRTIKNYEKVDDATEDMLQLRPMNLKELVRCIARTPDRIEAAQAKNVMFLLAVDARIPDFVMADRVRLRQLIYTLVENGIRFSDEGGKCSVTAELLSTPTLTAGESVTVRLSVTSSGRGFTETEAADLFKPFEQFLPGDMGLKHGVGIDLCVARRVALMHGSTLAMDSSIGKGVTLSVPLEFSVAPLVFASDLQSEVVTQPTGEQ